MTNKELIAQIAQMTVEQLLAYVLVSPTDLTDGYYSEFRAAILKRGQELGVY